MVVKWILKFILTHQIEPVDAHVLEVGTYTDSFEIVVHRQNLGSHFGCGCRSFVWVCELVWVEIHRKVWKSDFVPIGSCFYRHLNSLVVEDCLHTVSRFTVVRDEQGTFLRWNTVRHPVGSGENLKKTSRNYLEVGR